ncbi:32571_t:CDS:1, partial [Racocetra persica]
FYGLTQKEGGHQGLQLYRFSTLERIGEGGFGVVYKSSWKTRGLTVALKQLNNIPLNEEKTVQGFIKEAGNYYIRYKNSAKIL